MDGDASEGEKGCRRSTLSPLLGEVENSDGLARTCTTLRTTKSPERKAQDTGFRGQECEDKSQGSYDDLSRLMQVAIQWVWLLTVIMNGLRGGCEAAAGGGTTAALPMSGLNDSLHSEEVDALIMEEREELEDVEMGMNRIQSNDLSC